MKLTKQQLKQIVKEEFNKLYEGRTEDPLAPKGVNRFSRHSQLRDIARRTPAISFELGELRSRYAELTAKMERDEELTPEENKEYLMIAATLDPYVGEGTKMNLTKSQLKQIIKEELSQVLNEDIEGMTDEDYNFLIDNNFSDPPMGLFPAQEKAYVDALRKNPENHDDIFKIFQDYADANEREWESNQ